MTDLEDFAVGRYGKTLLVCDRCGDELMDGVPSADLIYLITVAEKHREEGCGQ